MSCYRPPLAHHKHLTSITMLERLNEELRLMQVMRIFANSEPCLRLVRGPLRRRSRGLAGGQPVLNMSLLAEHEKELLKSAA